MSVVTSAKYRGDTLIEVLFATAAFSLVAVGALLIMNQGTATAQRALEITLVRQEVDAQAETIRFLNASYVHAYQNGVTNYPANTPAGQWQLMQNSVKTTNATSISSSNGGTICQTPPQGSFILNTKKATFIAPEDGKLNSAMTFSQVHYDNVNQVVSAEGLWIEAIRSTTITGNNQDNAGYIDFYIRACWDSPGQNIPVTLDTVVRLYEPRG